MVAPERSQEYEAHAGAIAAAYDPALANALAKAADSKMARTGWEGRHLVRSDRCGGSGAVRVVS